MLNKKYQLSKKKASVFGGVALSSMIALSVSAGITEESNLVGAMSSSENNLPIMVRVMEEPVIDTYETRQQAFIKETERRQEELEEQRRKEEEERLRREEEERQAKLEEERQARLTAERRTRVAFDPYDVTKISEIRADELYEVLPDTMKHLAWAIADCEEIFSINSLFLAGLISQESSYATSSRAVNTNNLTGMAVYNDGSVGTVYDSQEESVYDTARQLHKNYLTPGGKYFNGTSVWNVNEKYCVDAIYEGHWADSISSIANGYLNNFKEKFMK